MCDLIYTLIITEKIFTIRKCTLLVHNDILPGRNRTVQQTVNIRSILVQRSRLQVNHLKKKYLNCHLRKI